MNYSKHYEFLIARAKSRTLDVYSERHHVLPKCMGGLDDAGNIVRLKPEEHYVAHLLLVKMHPGHHGLVWAASNMTAGNAKQRRSNKLYGWLRRRLSIETAKRATGRKHSPEALAKMSAAKLGKRRPPHSAETRLKMSLASKGIKKSAEHRLALSRAKIGTTRHRSIGDGIGCVSEI